MRLSFRKKDGIVIVLLLIALGSLLTDLTYAKYINWSILIDGTLWIVNRLKAIGFTRSTALSLLKGSLGMTVTMVTFVLNLSVSFFAHSEHKIFGIGWGDLQFEESPSTFSIYQWFLKIGILFPLFIIVALNLELCCISYALLICSYFVIYFQYNDLTKSYDKKVQRECVVRKMVGYVENEKDCIDDNVTDFCAILENIRKGIWETEGWNNAWLLIDIFLQKVMEFERDKCYMISCIFFEVIFAVPAEENVREQMIFVKKYIGGLRTANDEEKEEVVLWSLLCAVVMQWNAETMRTFLKWFTCLDRRSSQRILIGHGKLERSEISRQSAVILIMLEYWLYIYEDDVNIDCECVNKIYKHGKRFFIEDDEEHTRLIKMLDQLYEKKYYIGEDAGYAAAAKLCYDVRHQLNNTILMTKLKYELWER